MVSFCCIRIDILRLTVRDILLLKCNPREFRRLFDVRSLAA